MSSTSEPERWAWGLMKYNYSKTDTDNLKWFANDMSRASLSEIDLREGTIRGENRGQIYD